MTKNYSLKQQKFVLIVLGAGSPQAGLCSLWRLQGRIISHLIQCPVFVDSLGLCSSFCLHGHIAFSSSVCQISPGRPLEGHFSLELESTQIIQDDLLISRCLITSAKTFQIRLCLQVPGRHIFLGTLFNLLHRVILAFSIFVFSPSEFNTQPFCTHSLLV